MGSIDTQQSLRSYSVPDEARKVLKDAILSNDKVNRMLPKGTANFAQRIQFSGASLPSIPINWRFAESAAAMKGLEACLLAELVKRKYGVDIESATINTDHACLFFMSPLMWSFADTPSVSDDDFEPNDAFGGKNIHDFIPDYDLHKGMATSYRRAATNIYPTQDGRWFHLHGSLNPDKSLESIGFPPEPEDQELNTNWDKTLQQFIARMKTIDSKEMQHQASEIYGQAGVIAMTQSEFLKSEHGKANEHVALFEVFDVDSGHKACWWPSIAQTSAERPLAGLKVVDLCRIIAGPTITRGLAELGASVMRVTSPNQPDFSMLHVDMNWGKWNCSLDLKDEAQLKTLRELIMDADVVVQGYRPGVLDKYGLGQNDIIEMVKNRERGIVSVRENCYGWYGPWQGRTGWQQISDAVTGVSQRFGEAMGLTNDEPVTPVYPNSDCMTGISGVTGVLTALMRRAEKGGSYKVDTALNYYNQWLAESCGEYPADVWEDVWSRNGREQFRAWDTMGQTIPAYTEMIRKNSREIVFNKSFFQNTKTKAINAEFRTVKPIIQFTKGEVKLEYNIGTRGNGRDAARWPDDLMTEVVE